MAKNFRSSDLGESRCSVAVFRLDVRRDLRLAPTRRIPVLPSLSPQPFRPPIPPDYSDNSITKEDIFHYIYAILHHPAYRARYAQNLKRELPRIPLAPDFQAFANAGKELARLHVHYESLEPWPVEYTERKDVPFSQRVTKMRLSKDRTSLQVNDSLMLAGIPAQVFEYRLGSKSAVEWIVDQYQVKGESDPNREDDSGYIVRLVGQVVRVSIETVRIVKSLPSFAPAKS